MQICRQILAVLACLGMFQISVQAGDLQTKRVTQKLKAPPVSANAFQFLRKKPKAFSPIELRDGTGTLISPDRMLQIPGQGKISAKDYIALVNRIERGLNGYGYSLKDKGSKGLELTNQFLAKSGLRQQIDATRKTLKSGKYKSELSQQLLDRVNRSSSKSKLKASELIRTGRESAAKDAWLREARSASIKPCFSWSDSWGDRSTFQVGASTSGSVDGSFERYSVTNDSRITGYAFGAGGDILRIVGTSEYDSGTARRASIRGNLYLFGEDIGSISRAGSSGITVGTGRIGPVFDQSVSTSFPIAGIVTLDLTAGVRGQAYAEIAMTASPESWSALLIGGLGVDSSAYLEASVTIIGIRGGVGGSLKLLDASFTQQSEAGITTDGHRLFLFASQDYLGRINALSGKFYAFADIYNFWNPFDTGWQRLATIDIWNYDGLTLEGSFARSETKEPLTR